MKKLLLTSAIALAVVSSQGAVLRWSGAVTGGTGAYADGNSWTADNVNPFGSPPGPTDSHGLITDELTASMPTLSIAGGAFRPDVLAMGWGVGTTGQLTVAPTGSLVASQLIVGGAGGIGTLVMESGSSLTADFYLQIGHGGGSGTITMNGGTLDVAQLIASPVGTVNMANDAAFYIGGDLTGLGVVGGLIFAIDAGAGDSIQEVFNAGANRTEYTVIPEPATLGLVAAFGGALFFVRRKFPIV